MLACKNIEVKAGNKRLFSCPDLCLEKGMIALVGRNGSGKSTFLNSMLGEHKLLKGTLEIKGQQVDKIPVDSLARIISVVRSKPLLYGDYQVADILMLGRLPYQSFLSLPSNEDRHLVEEIAGRLGIGHQLKQEYNSLSDGEKQLVMVGRAMVQDTPIVLLDEPAAFLDLVNRQELMGHLKKLADEKNKLIIFSTHHIEVLSRYCDAVLLINDEQLRVLDEPASFEKEINQAFGLNVES